MRKVLQQRLLTGKNMKFTSIKAHNGYFGRSIIIQYIYPKITKIEDIWIKLPRIHISTNSINISPSPTLENLSITLTEISKTPSRNQKISIFSEYLTKYMNNEKALYNIIKISSCRIFEQKTDKLLINSEQLMIAEQTIMKALSLIFSKDVEQIYEDYKEAGSLSLLGKVYARKDGGGFIWGGDQLGDITLQYLVDKVEELYEIQGEFSQEYKLDLIVELMRETQNDIQLEYIIKILLGNLQIGLGEKSVIKALEILKNCWDETKFSDFITKIEWNVFGMKISDPNICNNTKLSIGLPMDSMRGRAANNMEAIRKYYSKFSSQIITEFKYDGERSQIHYGGQGQLILYSRGMELQNSRKYEILNNILQTHLSKIKGLRNGIFDAELIAIGENDSILSFQELSKNTEHILDFKNIKVMIFDIMMHNDISLLQAPIIQRKELLKEIFEENYLNNFFGLVKYEILNLEDQEFENKLIDIFQNSKINNCEGIFLKATEPSYYDITGGRNQWIKIKSLDASGISQLDNLDLVPIAAYYGLGKRKGTFGSYLMATYNTNTNKYEAVCKVGTGFSQEDLSQFSTFYNKLILPSRPNNIMVSKRIKPDVWLKACKVWEIKGDSLTLSPTYSAGIGQFEGGQGISIRFPRFISDRIDKNVHQSNTSIELVEMYGNQTRISRNSLVLIYIFLQYNLFIYIYIFTKYIFVLFGIYIY